MAACLLMVLGFATAAHSQEAPVPSATTDETALTPSGVSTGWSARVDTSGDLFGIGWRGDPDSTFTIETVEDEAWTAPQEVRAMGDDTGPDPGAPEGATVASVQHGTEPVWSGDASAVRVTLTSGSATDVELVTISVDTPAADSTSDEAALGVGGVGALTFAAAGIGPAVRRRREVATLLAVGLALASVAFVADRADAAGGHKVPAPPHLVGRKAWGAESPQCNPGTFNKVRFGIVHHTAGANSYNNGDGPGIVKGIQQYHMHGPFNPPYCDIAYNFLVDKYGHSYVGRAGSRRTHNPIFGAHTSGHNKGSFGVSILGNYQSAPFTSSAKQPLSDVIAWRFLAWDINPLGTTVSISAGGASHWPAGTHVPTNTITGHRDWNSTECPGNNVYNRMAGIRKGVAKRMGIT